MKVFDNDFVVSRNEAFVYDRKVENKDGSPFVVSSRLTSPMIRLTVADETYVADDRYILNRYICLCNDMTDDIVPKFYKTQPTQLMSGDGIPATNWNNKPGDNYNPVPTDISGVDKFNYSIYYIEENDERVYKRYVQDDDINGHWEDYSFRLVIPFDTVITKDWTSKNYVYALFMMDGTLYIDVMKDEVARIIVEQESISFDDAYAKTLSMSEEEMYDIILGYNNKDGDVTDVALIDGREVVIDRTDDRWSPYWSVDCNLPLLNPAKITVKNDPIGGLS